MRPSGTPSHKELSTTALYRTRTRTGEHVVERVNPATLAGQLRACRDVYITLVRAAAQAQSKSGFRVGTCVYSELEYIHSTRLHYKPNITSSSEITWPRHVAWFQSVL